MTAPDPRLGEIEAAEALAHVKCADCAKCRIAEEDCWCSECEHWGCEHGPDCEDDPKPTDLAYLLAELRTAREALARVEGVRRDLFEFSEDRGLAAGQCAAYRDASRAIDTALRAAVAAAGGGHDAPN